MFQQPIKKELLSGPGEIRVSPGAEDFDPNSILDEPEFTSQEALVPSYPSALIALSLKNNKISEPIEIAGLLKKLTTGRESLELSMECLFQVALVVAEKTLEYPPLQFMKLEFMSPEAGTEHPWEREGLELNSFSVDEVAGYKALIRLVFKPREHK